MANIPLIDNPAGLVSTGAVQHQDRSYLFYSRPNGTLAYLKSQITAESSPTEPETPPYKSGQIQVEDNPVAANVTSPQIAAVSYKMAGSNQIRVYYISPNGQLQELCKTDDKPWFHGSLNAQQYPAAVKSLLAASVDDGGEGQLKLYYNQEGSSEMWCAYVNMGSQNWSRHVIAKKF